MTLALSLTLSLIITSTIVNTLFYMGLTTLAVDSKPMILLKRKLGFKEELIGTGKGFLYDNFTELIYCTICSSLYITLCISLNFKLAVIVSFLFWLINKNKF